MQFYGTSDALETVGGNKKRQTSHLARKKGTDELKMRRTRALGRKQEEEAGARAEYDDDNKRGGARLDETSLRWN